MKRIGFTLAEILISVGIIGIVAALMLPMVNKYKPDINKILYLKTYDALREIIPIIASNGKAYPLLNARTGVVHDIYPLFNVYAIYDNKGQSWVGPSKICKMLAEGLNAGDDISCIDDYDSSLEPEFKKSFETTNGVQFMVQTLKKRYNYKTDIFIDINGDKEPNCFSTNSACKKPDRFKFLLAADGNLFAADILGNKFLDTRTNWKSNQEDSGVGELKTSLPNIFPEVTTGLYSSKEDIEKFLPEPKVDVGFKPVPCYKMYATPLKGDAKNKPAESRHFFNDSKYKDAAGNWEDNTKDLETLKKTEFIGVYESNGSYYAYLPWKDTYIWTYQASFLTNYEYLKNAQRENYYVSYERAKIYDGDGADKIDDNGQTW